MKEVYNLWCSKAAKNDAINKAEYWVMTNKPNQAKPGTNIVLPLMCSKFNFIVCINIIIKQHYLPARSCLPCQSIEIENGALRSDIANDIFFVPLRLLDSIIYAPLKGVQTLWKLNGTLLIREILPRATSIEAIFKHIAFILGWCLKCVLRDRI